MSKSKTKPKSIALAILALGVVFGDIGTSPLYAFETACVAAGGTPAAAIGTASLIIWTLFLVVTIKYVFLVMQASYQGEGGIFALMALLDKSKAFAGRTGHWLGVLMVCGAALLYGDGAITPAISVLSAVEGMSVVIPAFEQWVVPVTLTILILLFASQRFGTGRLGGIFGPVMLVWFLTLAGLGIFQIFQNPEIVFALNPWSGISLLLEGGWKAWAIVGAVVLGVTGAEALYADLGHFGRTPIVRAWRWIVFPALVLNYLGQAALVQRLPASAADPNLFFLMVPGDSLRGVLVVLATFATVIASQALISGVFSLSSQAMDLGYLPRMYAKHTSTTERGQIYISVVNFLLGAACVMLVLIFRNSSSLANAYGIAVTGAMIVTSIAFVCVVRIVWRRPRWQAGLLLVGLLAIDLPLFLSCFSKVFDGGVVPILLAAGVAVTMFTWHRGRELVRQAMSFGAVNVEELARRFSEGEFSRVRGTQVFVVRKPNPAHAVSSILEQYRRVHVIGEHVIILLLEPSWNNPTSSCGNLKVNELGGGLWQVIATHGYMAEPDVPKIMQTAKSQSGARLPFKMDDTFFVVARELIITSPKDKLPPWQRHFFAFLSRNVVTGPHFLNIPADRLILYSWLLRIENPAITFNHKPN